ncbi:MAG: maleylacetoacetate isomerase [Beijerinckiaceae bacterium]
MILHGYFRSSAAYRCRIALNLKGLQAETTFIHLRKGEQRSADYMRLNPHGLVPALEAGGHVLTQSLAIIEWLDETWPEPPLLPGDAFDRAHVRALALAVACDIHPLQNLRVLNHVRDAYGQDQQGVFAWGRHFIELGLDALEKQVSASGRSGRFCLGDAPTLADVCLVPQMFNAARFGADTGRLPTLTRIAANCEALPAFRDAHPARQPDFEP